MFVDAFFNLEILKQAWPILLMGLWQTVRLHPPRCNLFTAMLALLLLEMLTSSTLLVMLPVFVQSSVPGWRGDLDSCVLKGQLPLH